MSAKYQPPWIRPSGDLQDTAANVGLEICAEVYEKPQLETRSLQVVHELGGMLLVKSLNGLQLHNDLVEKTGACQRGARRSFFTLFSVSRERGFQSFPWSNHMYITTKFFEVPIL